jgi:hypothetical protein
MPDTVVPIVWGRDVREGGFVGAIGGLRVFRGTIAVVNPQEARCGHNPERRLPALAAKMVALDWSGDRRSGDR